MSKDFKTSEARAKLVAALNSENPVDLANAILDVAKDKEGEILNEMQAYNQTNDAEILANRGIQPLTSNERKFYNALQSGLKAGNIKAAFTGIESGFPEETMVRVLDNMKTEFPLLAEINIVDSSAVTKILKNKQGTQLAAWGALGSQITNNLNGNIEEVDLTLCKMLGCVLISTDMLDAKIEWLDAYIRAMLVECIGASTCAAVVSGTGNNQPIGMIKNLANQNHPNKTAKSVTYLDEETLGDIYSTLCVNADTNKTRAVGETIFVVNPITYYQKVVPAIKVRCADGYRDDLPFPIKFILDDNIDQNKAVIGIGKAYTLGFGTGGKTGTTSYSDDALFLDDIRVYKVKAYGNGMPDDNNAFVYLDISGLVKKPVTVHTIDDTPAESEGE